MIYYEAPSKEIFEEVRIKAIEIWKTYDDTFGYVTEKVVPLEIIENIEDNLMYIVNMFDMNNQEKLLKKLSKEARNAILDRYFSVAEVYYYPFNLYRNYAKKHFQKRKTVTYRTKENEKELFKSYLKGVITFKELKSEIDSLRGFESEENYILGEA